MSFDLSIDGFQATTGILQRQVADRRFAWDDEIPDFGICRSQLPEWDGPQSPPAVIRYFPVMKEDAGDFRVNLSYPYDWKPFFTNLNNDYDGRKFEYWTGPNRAQFNDPEGVGWPKFAYLGMEGNLIKTIEVINGWVKFLTLKPEDLAIATALHMTRASYSHLIHTFTCVGYDSVNKVTKHIMSTNTEHGIIDYPMVTKEGFACIPERFTKRL